MQRKIAKHDQEREGEQNDMACLLGDETLWVDKVAYP